jgi:hemoglobin
LDVSLIPKKTPERQTSFTLPYLPPTEACLMSDPSATLYAELGEPKLRSLVTSFYQRVREDEIIGPLYPQDDWAGAEKRLADFLIFRFGGPQTYIEERGHPRLRMRHMPFSIGLAERDRWLELMGAAMQENGIQTAHAEILSAFFAQVADFMRNRPEN